MISVAKVVVWFLTFVWVGYYLQEVIDGWMRIPTVITWFFASIFIFLLIPSSKD